MDVLSTINNTSDGAHNDGCVSWHFVSIIARLIVIRAHSVQYLQGAQTGLAHHNGLGSILGYPLHLLSSIEHVGNHVAFNSYPIQGNRSQPLTILNRHSHHYPCLWPHGSEPCNYMIQADTRQLLSHLKDHHGVQGDPKGLHRCRWQGCSMRVQYSSLARHLTTHLGIKIRCLTCSAEVARPDCARAHQKNKRFCSEATFQVIPGPNAHVFT